MKKTLEKLMLRILILGSILGMAGSVRSQESGQAESSQDRLGLVHTSVPAAGVAVVPAWIVAIELSRRKDANNNILSADARIDLALSKRSGPMPVVTRVEVDRGKAMLFDIVVPPNQHAKRGILEITNVTANVTTDSAKSIFSNPNGLSVTVFTTPRPREGTLTGQLDPVPSKKMHNEFFDFKNLFLSDVYGSYFFPTIQDFRNEFVFNFNLIREDSTPDNFNTYGLNIDYTRFLNPHVGVTGDFNLNSKQQNGVDLTKTSILGGITILPFNSAMTTDKVTISTHALFGVSHLTSSVGSVSVSNDSFAMKLGGAVDVNVNQRFFIRPIGVDYAPTFFGTTTQNNVQFTFGAGFRF